MRSFIRAALLGFAVTMVCLVAAGTAVLATASTPDTPPPILPDRPEWTCIELIMSNRYIAAGDFDGEYKYAPAAFKPVDSCSIYEDPPEHLRGITTGHWVHNERPWGCFYWTEAYVEVQVGPINNAAAWANLSSRSMYVLRGNRWMVEDMVPGKTSFLQMEDDYCPALDWMGDE